MTHAVGFEVDTLLLRAREETGLEDFGDASFRDGLERLVDGIETDAALSPVGRVAAETMLLGQLRNRLRVEDWWRRHPELAAERLERPIFVVGMASLPKTQFGDAFDPAHVDRLNELSRKNLA